MHFLGKGKFYLQCFMIENNNTITTYHTFARLSGLLSFLSLDQLNIVAFTLSFRCLRPLLSGDLKLLGLKCRKQTRVFPVICKTQDNRLFLSHFM